MGARQAAVIARVRSRRGRDALRRVPHLLLERGIDVVESRSVDRRKELRKAVKAAIRNDIPLIVVCGGDGTLTSVVALFAHRPNVLGIVPSGTVNSFSRNLGIDQSFESAADVIAFGQERRVDLGRVNGRYFANFLTVGLESEAADRATRGLKRIFGPLAYGVAAFVPFFRHRSFRCQLRWRKHRIDVETHQAIIANGRYYGYRPLDENATQSDDKLTVFVRDATSRIDVLETYLALLRGEQRSLDGATLWNVPGPIELRARPPQRVAVDGRALGRTPIRVSVEPAALRVMVATT